MWRWKSRRRAADVDERIRTIEGELSARGLRFGIVASRFNDFIVDRLLQAAVDTLLAHGAEAGDIQAVRVPGAYETPVAIRKMAESRRYDALIALGCVIRGATPHFDYVAGECARGVTQVGLKHGKPVIFGVLTTDTVEQALERADRDSGNKGFDVAMAALQMLGLIERLEGADFDG